MIASTELRCCFRCGRRRRRLELAITSMGDAWAYFCIDRDLCDAAALAASRSRSRRMIAALLSRVGGGE